MGDKNKVALGGQDGKAQLPQGLRRPVSGGRHLGTALGKVVPILHRCHTGQNGQLVDGIGVDGIFDTVQPLDEVLTAKGEAHPHPCQGTGLGHGLHYQQVGVLVQQGQGRGAAEVDIGFVHDDHHIRISLQNAPQGRLLQLDASGGIGVGDDHAIIVPQHLLHRNGEVVLQGDGAVVDAEHIAVDRIEGIGDVRKQDGTPFLKERLALLDAVGLRQRRHQLAGVRIGIELEPLVHPLLYRFHHLGGGWVGVLVGV